MCSASRCDFEKYLAWRGLRRRSGFHVPNKSDPYTSCRVIALFIARSYRRLFLMSGKAGRWKNRQASTRSGNDNFIRQCRRHNCIPRIQFTNGPCIEDDFSLAAFTYSSGNGYTIINPVRYYDADDGLPRPCPGNDSSLSARSTWSIEINDHPLGSFGCYSMIFVDDDSRVNNIHNMSVTCDRIFFSCLIIRSNIK